MNTTKKLFHLVSKIRRKTIKSPVISFIDTVHAAVIKDQVTRIKILPHQRSFEIRGWAVDSARNTGVENVTVCIEDTEFAADYGLTRTDVADSLVNPAFSNVGFSVFIPACSIKQGLNKVSLKIKLKEVEAYLPDLNACLIDFEFMFFRGDPDEKHKNAIKTGHHVGPLVSVIIPCFNDGKYLPEALASVDEISGVDFEVIIIDDGSTDVPTVDYLRSLKNEKYFVLRKAHQGVSAARNEGIKISKGKYILLLDADNHIKPEYVIKGVDFLEKNTEFSIFYSDFVVFGKKQLTHIQPDLNLLTLLATNGVDNCAIYRKEVWEVCGGYDEKMAGFEDWDFWIKAYSYGYKFYHQPEPLFYYRLKSEEESLNLQCHRPGIYSDLIRHIYSKHSLLINNYLRELASNPYHGQPEAKPAGRNHNQEDLQQYDALIASMQQKPDEPISPQEFLVSVIICTYNRWTYLNKLLQVLKNQSYPHFEVIVVNGPSTDETYKVKELFPSAKYTEIAERNISASRNKGLRLAKGEAAIFIDDDALPCDNEWIARFATVFKKDKRIKAIAAPVKTGVTETYEFYRVFGGFYGVNQWHWPDKDTNMFDFDPKNPLYPFETAQGSNMAFRKEALVEIGGFDEYFVYLWDDTDVMCRLYKNGCQISNISENVQRHYRGPSASRGNGAHHNWLRIARSLAYYGMKNGIHPFPIRFVKVIQALLFEKYRDINQLYKKGEIRRSRKILYLARYFLGAALGMLDGIFKPRKTTGDIKTTVESPFVYYNNYQNKPAKFRIAVIAPRSESGETGGAERFHEGLTKSLNTKNTEADLITVTCGDGSFAEIIESYLKCHNLDLSEYDAVVSTKVPTYAVRHPNHVNYHQHTHRIFYDMFGKSFPDPDFQLYQQRETILKLDSLAMQPPNTRKIFAQGFEIRNRILKYNNLESEVLHPAMYFNSTKPGRYEYVFMPGRLHVWKRIDLMIKAMQYVKEPVSLIISGTGEDRIRLEIMAAFDGRIKFTGYISDREQADLYANALVVAFVPVREDFGYITLEAFAHEKPVITCTDSGEPLQFVEDGISGFVVEPDPKEIAVKIEHLLQNPAIAEKMGKQGRSKIEHLLNWSEISEKIISTLQNTNA